MGTAPDDEHTAIVNAIRDRAARLAALESGAADLRAELLDHYRRGIELKVPKIRMAEAAGVSPEAIWHALRKADKAAEQPAPEAVPA